jgi:hypothetical protein
MKGNRNRDVGSGNEVSGGLAHHSTEPRRDGTARVVLERVNNRPQRTFMYSDGSRRID